MDASPDPGSKSPETEHDEDSGVLHYGDPLAELESLRASRGVRDGGSRRLLRVCGADAADLLHRLSAGRVPTRAGEFRRLPFTDNKGRLVDVPWVRPGEECLELVCGRGRRDALKGWIERYIILEDARCEAVDGARILEGIPEEAPRVLAGEPGSGLSARLTEQGLTLAGELAWSQHCAESLQLRPGLDLDERFHPLEAGLRHWVAFDKGCYIGQEVVARLENYDKVRRRPALAHGPRPLPTDTPLLAEGKRAAQFVHAGERLDADGAYALLLLEREIREGAALRAEDGAEWTVVRAAEA